MKNIARTLILLVGVSLMLAQAGLAQNQSAQNTDILRSKIEMLERTDIKSKSDKVQEIYKLTLLRLYSQLNTALQQEMTDLKNIQSAASGTDADPKNEIAGQLKQLATERAVLVEKIQTLTGEARASATAETLVPNPAPADTGAEADSVSLPISGSAARRARSVVASDAEVATPAPSPAQTASGETPATPAATPAADTTSKITICGQIRPASLKKTLALITNLPSTSPVKTMFDDSVRKSHLGDDCMPDTGRKVGDQRDAVIGLLQNLVKNYPKDVDPQFSPLSLAAVKKQIVLIEEYTSNVAIHITKDNGDLIATAFSDQDGNYKVELEPNTAGQFYFVSTEGDDYGTKRKVVLRTGDSKVRVNLDLEDRPVSLLARSVVGYEQAGASAAKKEQNYFFNLYLSKPFPFHQSIDPDFGEPLRLWGDIRFDSIPQEGDSTVGAFAGNFVQSASGVKVKDAARVFEFLAGFEYRLAGNNSLLPSFDRQTKQKFSLSLIASFGTITPVNPQDTISVFKVFADAPGLPPAAVGKDFVAFVASDRDRFFRQYYGGIRIQTFFFNRNNMPLQRFPAQLDVTYGQNEFVTGGHFRGGVFRLEGYYPLPYEEMKFINLFGTALLRPGRAKTGLPLILEPAPAGTTVPAANVALVETPQFRRDYYRVGVGIDFISFMQSLKKLGNK